MTQHTPGPWLASGSSVTAALSSDSGIQIKIARVAGEAEESIANALLMAAAPELLDALLLHEEAQKALDDADEHGACAEAEGWRNDPTGSCWVSESYNAANRLFEQAREKRLSAIAKATGASS